MPTDRLRIKRIYEDADDTDGARILVDRVWPRGITKERAGLTLWLKDVAPSTALRKWFGHDPKKWTKFREKYRAELDRNQESVEQLLAVAKKGRTTLLYGAHDTEHNQALVLLEYIKGLRAR